MNIFARQPIHVRRARHRYPAIAVILCCLADLSAAPVAAEPPRGGPERLVWSPVPVPETPYVAPNKPLTRIQDILATHAGEKSWIQPVVRTDAFAGDYISLAPGEATKAMFFSEERVVIWVYKGKLDVEIEGQPKTVISDGYLIDVAPTLIHKLTNTGQESAIYFRLTSAGQKPSYPVTENPEPIDGYSYVKVRMSPYGKYEAPNQPVLDFNRDVVAKNAGSRDFAMDGHTSAHIIRERGIATPPDSEKGHFHANLPEIWLVIEGRIEAKISGEPLVSGGVGDVILAAKSRWHRASAAGPGMSTRLALMPRYKEGLAVMQEP